MNGQMHSSLLACSVQLVDHNAGSGGFCVVPGSHKSNFKMPDKMIGKSHLCFVLYYI